MKKKRAVASKANADAHKRILAAKIIRHTVQTVPDNNPGINRMDLVNAAIMEKAAIETLALPEVPELGIGGEYSPPFSYCVPGMTLAVKDPTSVNLNASIHRIELADGCGAFDLALDTAESLGAKNAAEQMLAHQMAAVHKTAMQLLENSTGQRDTVEIARLTNAAARLMDTFQKAMLTLQRVRSGGRQVVTVQHVQVKDGGQAVINGTVTTGGYMEAEKDKK